MCCAEPTTADDGDSVRPVGFGTKGDIRWRLGTIYAPSLGWPSSSEVSSSSHFGSPELPNPTCQMGAPRVLQLVIRGGTIAFLSVGPRSVQVEGN